MNRRTMLSYFRTRDKGGTYSVLKNGKIIVYLGMSYFYYLKGLKSYLDIPGKGFRTFCHMRFPNVKDQFFREKNPNKPGL